MDALKNIEAGRSIDAHGVNRPLVAWMVLAAVSLLIWAAAMHPIRDPDFGWHLAMGRHIAEHRAVPTTEPFTHTAFGAPMVAHEWLAQLLMYAPVESLGVVGLRWLHATGVVAILVFFFAILRRRAVPPALAVLGMLLFALVARSRFELRPQMFNLAAMMILFDFVFLRRPRLDLRQQLGIAGGVAIWANMHSGAILFPVLLAGYFAVEWTWCRFGWRDPDETDLGEGRLGRVASLTGLTAFATLMTPNHVRLIPYVFESNRINRALSSEWASIVRFWGDPTNLPFEIEALIVCALGLLWAVWRHAKNAPGLTAVVCVLALLPLSSARFVDFYFAPIAYGLTVASTSIAQRERHAGTLQWASIAAYAVVFVAAVAALAPQVDTAQWRLLLRPAGNFQPATFPAGAVRFLDEAGLHGRLYTLERWGGYVLLRTDEKYPIFIDGRWITIGERVTRDALEIERRGKQTFTKLDAYGVDLLLVPRGWMTEPLAREHGWISLFENFNAGVYLRASAASDLAKCVNYYQRIGIPFDRSAGFDGRIAQHHNPDWAYAFRVEPRHIVHFRLWGNPIGVSPDQVVKSW